MQQFSQTPPKQKPPYLLGLLCLIPLIGAFVGFALLLFGIFKYKDKWFAMIGAFGILLTVGIYSSLFYYLRHGSLAKKGFEQISQMQLNNLVRYIEFYKLEHGQYPDDLTQISKEDGLAPVNDPVQAFSLMQNSYFNYKRIGDKYLLFSSGQDGIPHTKDDLFPEIIIGDSSKIGLIK